MFWRLFSQCYSGAWHWVRYVIEFISPAFIIVELICHCLIQLAPPAIAFTEALAALKNMTQVINRQPLINGLSEEGLRPDTKPKGEIALKDVHFSYPSRSNHKKPLHYSI